MGYNKKRSLLPSGLPVAACAIDSEGTITETNEKMGTVFVYDGIIDGNIFALTGIRAADLVEDINAGTSHVIKRNDKFFKMFPYYPDSRNTSDMVILFYDVTTFEGLKSMYNAEKPCCAKIQIDNYDELIENSTNSPNLALSTEIDQLIRKLATKLSASVIRTKAGSYVLWFEQKNLEKLIENKFEILNEVRNIESNADFPASLSIGVGAIGRTIEQTEEFASGALELALGRGGDQAVVKRGNNVEYFGGKLQTVEKSNKGKSRIIGHALRRLIQNSDKIFVMGHKNADMDSFGAALGICRLCLLSDKSPSLVIDEVNESLQAIYNLAVAADTYNIIDSATALESVTENSTVIVVDTNRPSLAQCTELLEKCSRIAVIDHHRKMEESIENPTLSYMESYASSASELVSEILQYMTTKREITKLEAEALLGGMIIDTNGFFIKTGVRTFDAAAWLRRQGADPTEVKRFFQENLENAKLKAAALSNVQVSEAGIAITSCEQVAENAQILCAQVADNLLTLKGVKASFVVGRNKEMKTVISARSLGDVNVQVIMEKFGGGGHLTTAAAQVDLSIDEARAKIKEIMEAE